MILFEIGIAVSWSLPVLSMGMCSDGQASCSDETALLQVRASKMSSSEHHVSTEVEKFFGISAGLQPGIAAGYAAPAPSVEVWKESAPILDMASGRIDHMANVASSAGTLLHDALVFGAHSFIDTLKFPAGAMSKLMTVPVKLADVGVKAAIVPVKLASAAGAIGAATVGATVATSVQALSAVAETTNVALTAGIGNTLSASSAGAVHGINLKNPAMITAVDQVTLAAKRMADLHEQVNAKDKQIKQEAAEKEKAALDNLKAVQASIKQKALSDHEQEDKLEAEEIAGLNEWVRHEDAVVEQALMNTIKKINERAEADRAESIWRATQKIASIKRKTSAARSNIKITSANEDAEIDEKAQTAAAQVALHATEQDAAIKTEQIQGTAAMSEKERAGHAKMLIAAEQVKLQQAYASADRRLVEAAQQVVGATQVQELDQEPELPSAGVGLKIGPVSVSMSAGR